MSPSKIAVDLDLTGQARIRLDAGASQSFPFPMSDMGGRRCTHESHDMTVAQRRATAIRIDSRHLFLASRQHDDSPPVLDRLSLHR